MNWGWGGTSDGFFLVKNEISATDKNNNTYIFHDFYGVTNLK